MSTPQDTVVLLHGIGHTRWDMLPLEWVLKRRGYKTLNITYPSLRHDLKNLAIWLHATLNAAGVWQHPGKVHFVTHSMGGLVTRQYLHDFRAQIDENKIGRVVMIAPPNGGSEIANLLQNFSFYKLLFGPAGQELTTTAQGRWTIEPDYELGIIAGTVGWFYVLGNMAIKETHDGRVSVEKTKLKGMRAHIALPATHSFMPWKPSVHRQVISFLQNGNFAAL